MVYEFKKSIKFVQVSLSLKNWYKIQCIYYKTHNVHSLWDTNPDGKRNTSPKVHPKKLKRNH